MHPTDAGQFERSATVDDEHAGMRVDVYLSDVLDLFHRSQIAHRSVTVAVDGAPVKLSRRLRAGQLVTVRYTTPPPVHAEAQPVGFEILYEDADVVVINKPRGLVVHPGAGNRSGTLVNGLLYHVQGLGERFGDQVRPGIVHRLDKDTTGVLIAAKSPAALDALARQFAHRTTEKRYLAVVTGMLKGADATIDAPIGRDPRHRQRFAVNAPAGKPAVTRYRVIGRFDRRTLVELRPETGRTHQLRVHMASLGCPIVGDAIYGRSSGDDPLLLHAWSLRIVLPGESAAREFVAQVPEDFSTRLPQALRRRIETSYAPAQPSTEAPRTEG